MVGGVRSPSHNTQPWLLGSRKIIEILPNLKRALAQSDPQNRALLEPWCRLCEFDRCSGKLRTSFESKFATGGDAVGSVSLATVKEDEKNF
jgi:hypothetical protein